MTIHLIKLLVSWRTLKSSILSTTSQLLEKSTPHVLWPIWQNSSSLAITEVKHLDLYQSAIGEQHLPTPMIYFHVFFLSSNYFQVRMPLRMRTWTRCSAPSSRPTASRVWCSLDKPCPAPTKSPSSAPSPWPSGSPPRPSRMPRLAWTSEPHKTKKN